MKTKLQKPQLPKCLHVKDGNTTIRIYKTSYQAKGNAYQQFTIAYNEGGRRIRKSFHTYEKARTESERIANRLEQGHRDVARMKNSDAELFALAQKEAQKAELPLLEMLRLYNSAAQLLPENGSLINAARDYAEKHNEKLPGKSVAEAVDEFLLVKEQDHASLRYRQTLKYHLTHFKNAFHTQLASVTSIQIDEWLRKLGHSPRTRRNFLLSIVTLFRFARGLGYLPKNVPTEAEGVLKPKPRGGDIGILKPGELKALLLVTDPDMRQVYIAIGAFAGLRRSEIGRLEWRDINFQRKHIEVTALKSKTASRRIVPICRSLQRWLAPHKKKIGRLFPTERSVESILKWVNETLDKWPSNALRHSFVSYRVAQTQDVAKVSLEAGNSPSTIFKNYRELVAKADAKQWFSIKPI